MPHARFASTQIFKTQERFELIVEGGDFRGRHTHRKRNEEPFTLYCGGRDSWVRCRWKIKGPQAIVGVAARGKGQQSSAKAKRISQQFL